MYKCLWPRPWTRCPRGAPANEIVQHKTMRLLNIMLLKPTSIGYVFK